jgi:predicted nucleotidyltransferase component of viral defense system
MPLTPFQADVFKIIAQNRSPASYVAGGTALHARNEGARFSDDIDIFHDLDEALLKSIARDEQSLTKAGYQVKWLMNQKSFHRAIIEKSDLSIKVEWAKDSAFRFFPIIEDPKMGFRLHDADLATNKVLACAGRSESRDFFDVLHLDKNYLPLGAMVWAACGKDEGYTPDLILDQMSRNSKFRHEDFESFELSQPVDLKAIKRQWIDALSKAREFINVLPPETVGSLFLFAGKPIAPQEGILNGCQIHQGAIHGAWPVLV